MIKTYSFDRVKMARNLTLEQLHELEVIVKAEHKLEQRNSIHLFDKKGLKKLDNIGWAIYHKAKRGGS